MRKNKLFLLLLAICAVICCCVTVDLMIPPAEIPLRENTLYGTWYCDEYDTCIVVDEVGAQFYYLASFFPYEDTQPEIDGSTVTWREAIGSYSYIKEEDTEKLVCIGSNSAQPGAAFVKTEPIAELEDIYNNYYSETYKSVTIGPDKTSLKMHTGSSGTTFYPSSYGRFIVGDKLYVGGECFRINKDGKYIHLEHCDLFDYIDEEHELYDALVEVFVPWEEIDWYQYHDSDIWGEWAGLETGNKLCIYEDSYEIRLSTGEEIKRSNWSIENDVVVISDCLAFYIQKVDGQLQLVTGEFQATIEADTYVKVKPHSET